MKIKLHNDSFNKYIGFVLYTMLYLAVVSCEPWNETADASHVSESPMIEIIGDEFESYIVVDSAEYTDDGATASSSGESLVVSSFGEVDLTEVGVYLITYYAENKDGISSTKNRVIAVTYEDVTKNDLTGEYEGTNWNPLTKMKVTRLHDKGYYKAEEALGFPDSEVSGTFVDLGQHELFLVQGDGEFGRYAGSFGEYTLSSLTWTIKLVDSPYNGLEIAVLWRKIFD